jgi:hypothetical protein
MGTGKMVAAVGVGRTPRWGERCSVARRVMFEKAIAKEWAIITCQYVKEV